MKEKHEKEQEEMKEKYEKQFISLKVNNSHVCSCLDTYFVYVMLIGK